MLIPVILCGGLGRRLWPLSRLFHPKQFIELFGQRTLLQNTALRIGKQEDSLPPIVICNQEHRFLVAEQLLEMGVHPTSIMLEPEGRNTAPAIAVAAFKALAIDPDPILLVLPSDHYLKEVECLKDAVHKGIVCAREDHLIAFGVTPSKPETGYGYIQRGEVSTIGGSEKIEGREAARQIKKFTEKPDAQTARQFVDSGEYLWNSGIFMFKASRILTELKQFAPDIFETCLQAYEKGTEDTDFFRLDPESFSRCRSDSIDYAVMEKTKRGVVVPLLAGWDDLGSWESMWRIGAKDENNNVKLGDTLTIDTKNCYLHSTGRLLTAVGVNDLALVETKDAVLAVARDRAQDVSKLVELLKNVGREEIDLHREVFRPWGSYEGLDMGEGFQVKRIVVKPGQILSLQLHHRRAEHWTVVSGTAVVTLNDQRITLKPDESVYIPVRAKHRVENPEDIPLIFIEVQCGAYLGEDDIVRFDDIYGRESD